MVTALLIVVAVILLLALVGVCAEIAGGSFLGVWLFFGGAVGSLLELLAEVVAAILDGFKS